MAGRAPHAPLHVATFTPAGPPAKPVYLGVKPVCIACVPGDEPGPSAVHAPPVTGHLAAQPTRASPAAHAHAPRPPLRPAASPPCGPRSARDLAPRARASSRPTGGAAGARCAARAVSGAGQGGRPPLRSRGRAGVERQRCSGTHAAAPGQSARALRVLPRPPTSHLVTCSAHSPCYQYWRTRSSSRVAS